MNFSWNSALQTINRTAFVGYTAGCSTGLHFSKENNNQGKHMMKAKVTSRISLAVMLVASVPSHATILGGFPGRTVNATENSGTAVEAFYSHFSDANSQGIRLSHRYNSDILIFADAAQFKLDSLDEGPIRTADDFSGNAFGVGAMYFKPDLIEGYDAAISASYHKAGLDTGRTTVGLPELPLFVDGWEMKYDISVIKLQLIVSSREPIAENGLQWYAGAIGQRVEQDLSPDGNRVTVTLTDNTPLNVNEYASGKASDTEIGATAGLVLPTSFGQVYAAAEYIDGLVMGVGVRYNLK